MEVDFLLKEAPRLIKLHTRPVVTPTEGTGAAASDGGRLTPANNLLPLPESCSRTRDSTIRGEGRGEGRDDPPVEVFSQLSSITGSNRGPHLSLPLFQQMYSRPAADGFAANEFLSDQFHRSPGR